MEAPEDDRAGGPRAARFRTPLAALRRLAQPRPVTEQCDFCSATLNAGHRHLLEVATGKIICACSPCALRFENVVGRWKLIPQDTRLLPDFQMSDAEWESLALPIQLVFFFYSTPAAKTVAYYPSPAGATESLLPMASWKTLAAANPPVARMEPDVQALLVNRLGAARQYFIVPIDRCYELAGLIRLHWRGLSGGETVWRELDQFFAGLSAGTGPARWQQEVAHA